MRKETYTGGEKGKRAIAWIEKGWRRKQQWLVYSVYGKYICQGISTTIVPINCITIPEVKSAKVMRVKSAGTPQIMGLKSAGIRNLQMLYKPNLIELQNSGSIICKKYANRITKNHDRQIRGNVDLATNIGVRQ